MARCSGFPVRSPHEGSTLQTSLTLHSDVSQDECAPKKSQKRDKKESVSVPTLACGRYEEGGGEKQW